MTSWKLKFKKCYPGSWKPVATEMNVTDGMNSFASTWFLLENEHVVGCHKGYIYFM